MKNQLAIYARYSSDQQRKTSIEDQIRRCTEFAERLGLDTSKIVIYSDQSLSGLKKHSAKRTGYRDLLKAIDANEVSFIIADELGRLTREPVENAQLMERLENNGRLRLITTNGIDTNNDGWQLLFGITGATARHEVRSTQHRVVRGMIGQLERGFMIATPAFGYQLKRELDGADNRVGSHWIIDETKAGVVREIFERRAKGQSMHQIARWLNESGVACSRSGRDGSPAVWRPARVKNILQNPIYRGVFVWHGSSSVHYKAKKKGVALEQKEFARPSLRLVSDEIWFRCSSKSISRTGYGGGKHAFSGLITCGCCGGTLVLSAQTKRTRSVYCASCTVAKSTQGQQDRQTDTVAIEGVEALLKQALKTFLTPAFIAEFQHSLMTRLEGDQTPLIHQKETDISAAKRALVRLSKMLVANDDDLLEARYNETRAQLFKLEAELEKLVLESEKIDAASIQQLLSVDPSNLIDGLFDEDIPPEELRTHLVRLFPSIVFEGKQSHFRSVFRVRFDVAAALSFAGDLESPEYWEKEQRFEVRYVPTHRHQESKGHWTVTLLAEGDKHDDDVADDNILLPAVLPTHMKLSAQAPAFG